MAASFYILSIVTLLAGVLAMTLRNLVHCALCLSLSFIGVAGIFLHLNAPFAAFAQILVYVGAVAILVLFAVLLTRNSEIARDRRSSSLLPSIALAVLTAAILLSAIAGTRTKASTANAPQLTVPEIGNALMTSHVLPLELLGVMLTIALLGAVVLALPEKMSKDQEGQS